MSATIELGLQFIARAAGQSDPKLIVSDFLETVRAIGFDSAACGAWAGVGKNRRTRFFFVDWPEAWLAYYEKSKAAEHDVLLIEARRQIASFLWSEAVRRYSLTRRQKALYDAGIAFGWRDIFAVPIHGPGSLQGLVTLAARKDLTLSPVERSVLEAMSRTIWETCRAAAGFGVFAPEAGAFSARELECLQWAATGKTDGAIAKLLGIQPATAHFHIEQAKRRLGVRSRIEAIAIGILNGLI